MTGNNLHNHWGEQNIFLPAFAMWCNPAFASGGFLKQAELDGSAQPLLPPFLLHSPEHLAGVVLILVSMLREKNHLFFHTQHFLDLHAEMIHHREGQTNSERKRSGAWKGWDLGKVRAGYDYTPAH